jgi:hypothetical protein
MGKKSEGGLKDEIKDALRELPDSWLDAVKNIVKGDKEGQRPKPRDATLLPQGSS